MNKKAVETLAVNAVRDSIVMSDFLDQFIADNDKEPSWDGFIYIYNNKNKKKDQLKGRVPVQVKGTENDDFSKQEINHSISTIDLKNYLYNGGVVFFVVFIGNKGLAKKIYYVELPPVKLRIILASVKNQKTKTVSLKAFPTEGNKKATILLNCYTNCQKQSSFADAHLLSLEELEEQGVLEGVTASVTSYGTDDLHTALLTNEVYMYAQIKGCAIPQPLEHIPERLYISHEIKAPVIVDGAEYYSFYHVVKNADETTIRIGESFTITFGKNIIGSKINYKTSDKLRVVVRDLGFLLACIEKGSFQINGVILPFPTQEIDFKDFSIDEERKRLDYYSKAIRVMDILNVNGELQRSKMSEEDWRNLDKLITAFIDQKPISNLKHDLNFILKMKISDYLFLLVFQHYDGKDDTYNIYDFFSTKLEMCYEDQDGEKHDTSQYAVLKKDDYTEISNIRFEKILPSFQNASYDQDIFERANWVLLDLLTAYDSCEKSIILKTANDFAEWLMSAPENVLAYKLRILNKLQVVRREREFNIEEIRELYSIIEDNTSTESVLVGAHLLLGNQAAAEIHYDKLDEKLQEEFKGYPIYYFWKEN